MDRRVPSGWTHLAKEQAAVNGQHFEELGVFSSFGLAGSR